MLAFPCITSSSVSLGTPRMSLQVESGLQVKGFLGRPPVRDGPRSCRRHYAGLRRCGRADCQWLCTKPPAEERDTCHVACCERPARSRFLFLSSGQILAAHAGVGRNLRECITTFVADFLMYGRVPTPAVPAKPYCAISAIGRRKCAGVAGIQQPK